MENCTAIRETPLLTLAFSPFSQLELTSLDSFSRGRGAKTALKAATAADSSVTATFYQIDVGAVGATRIYMALSHTTVDGSERGEAVLTPSTWKGKPAKSHVTGRRTGSLRLVTGQGAKSNTQSRTEAA
jgi:hypothetical protein